MEMEKGDKMSLYFSHPTFTFRTKTERRCIEIIEKGIGPDEIVNPGEYGLRDNPVQEIEEVEKLVGMAISGKLLYLVWKEMKIAFDNDVEIYTIYVEDKTDLGPLVKGVPDDIDRLSKEKSNKLANEIIKGSNESIFSMFMGNWGRRF